MSIRKDALGIFWEDLPPEPKTKQEKVKRTPPDPVWLEPDYLPYLEEAKAFDFVQYTDEELVTLAEPLVFDVESNPNYFLAMFQGTVSKKIVYFESYCDSEFNADKLRWLIENKLIVGFNSRWYDVPLLALAVQRFSNNTLWKVTDWIINKGELPWNVLAKHEVPELKCNHIDLIEVAPLHGSLKVYGARMHVKRLQDLPFPPGLTLSYEQALITRLYCANDLDITMTLLETLDAQVTLREKLSAEFLIDLRSKSDAQIAESVITATLRKLHGARPTTPPEQFGRHYRYRPQEYMNFQSDIMRATLDHIANLDSVVGPSGAIPHIVWE